MSAAGRRLSEVLAEVDPDLVLRTADDDERWRSCELFVEALDAERLWEDDPEHNPSGERELFALRVADDDGRLTIHRVDADGGVADDPQYIEVRGEE